MNAVIEGARTAWDRSDWQSEVALAHGWLRAAGVRVLGSLLDNGPAFLALDEAALAAGVVHVPLPPFFTPAQIAHALGSAGADTLVSGGGLHAALPQRTWTALHLGGETLQWARLTHPRRALHTGTAKISFTSGTTGQPKGVCLSATALNAVADGVVQALKPLAIERHLSALPYAVLLENLAGAMAARRQGATVIALPLQQIGLQGSSRFDPAVFDAAVRAHDAQSLILLPQMLRAWCGYLGATGQRASAALKFVAVGGAPVGAPLLGSARALGVPAYEGYGLSEGASVQTLNLPWAVRDGSVGRALPHARLRTSDSGEIEVQGSLYLGYLGAQPAEPPWLATGDLGRIDAEGFVHIEGRRKNVLITGFGRNVSPEWVETALQQHAAVRQAVVFGDGQAALSAVVWPTPGAGHAAIGDAVQQANAALPDYARVRHWVPAHPAPVPESELFTANGRPLRARIETAYAPWLYPQSQPVPTHHDVSPAT